MILNTATILNYKNIAEARMECSPKLNCLIGNNGQGKTNVLDAIYYLSMCRSYVSTADNSSVIKHGEPYMMLQGSYTRCEAPVEISIALQRGKQGCAPRRQGVPAPEPAHRATARCHGVAHGLGPGARQRRGTAPIYGPHHFTERQ